MAITGIPVTKVLCSRLLDLSDGHINIVIGNACTGDRFIIDGNGPDPRSIGGGKPDKPMEALILPARVIVNSKKGARDAHEDCIHMKAKWK